MLSTTELQIIMYAAGAILAANFIVASLHFLYRALKDGPLRQHINEVIYFVDEVADDMSNEKKREKLSKD